MDTITCASADTTGKATQTAACNCGTNALVPVTAAEFCEVKTGVVGEKLAKIKCTQSTAASPDHAAVTGGCLCGSNDVDVAQTKFCGHKTDGTGLQMDKLACTITNGNGQDSVGTACNCGTNALLPIATTEFCYITSGVVGVKLTVKQCAKNAANQADGTTVAASDCACGSTASALKGCGFCLETAGGKAGAIASEAWAACSPDNGTGKFKKKPNKCKCGNGAASYDEYCLASHNGPIAVCSNNDGTVVNGAAPCACVNSATGVSQVTLAGGLCNAGTASTVQPCANDGSTSAKLGANTPPCTCGGAANTCTTGQICRATATTKCAAFSPTPAPTAAPTYGAVTIVQKLTMSGTQTDYVGNVKSLAEEAYGSAIGIFDSTLATPAYKTGCSVTSVASASRRAYAVTFTATVASAQSSAASTASTALTASGFATAAAAVKTANNAAYGSVTAPTATAVAAPSITTPTTVSGASTVTTSIMAMAVAVLAAFQARQ